MKDKHYILIYVIGFIITFGAAWNRNPATEDHPLAPAAEKNAVQSLMCSMFWPLYWSFRAFQP